MLSFTFDWGTEDALTRVLGSVENLVVRVTDHNGEQFNCLVESVDTNDPSAIRVRRTDENADPFGEFFSVAPVHVHVF